MSSPCSGELLGDNDVVLQLWALLYNIVTVPIAAGVLYPVGHVRLAPAWASLAMALS